MSTVINFTGFVQPENTPYKIESDDASVKVQGSFHFTTVENKPSINQFTVKGEGNDKYNVDVTAVKIGESLEGKQGLDRKADKPYPPQTWQFEVEVGATVWRGHLGIDAGSALRAYVVPKDDTFEEPPSDESPTKYPVLIATISASDPPTEVTLAANDSAVPADEPVKDKTSTDKPASESGSKPPSTTATPREKPSVGWEKEEVDGVQSLPQGNDEEIPQPKAQAKPRRQPPPESRASPPDNSHRKLPTPRSKVNVTIKNVAIITGNKKPLNAPQALGPAHQPQPPQQQWVLGWHMIDENGNPIGPNDPRVLDATATQRPPPASYPPPSQPGMQPPPGYYHSDSRHIADPGRYPPVHSESYHDGYGGRAESPDRRAGYQSQYPNPAYPPQDRNYNYANNYSAQGPGYREGQHPRSGYTSPGRGYPAPYGSDYHNDQGRRSPVRNSYPNTSYGVNDSIPTLFDEPTSPVVDLRRPTRKVDSSQYYTPKSSYGRTASRSYNDRRY